VGEPGLEARLHRAHETWFAEHCGGLDGAGRMPWAWPKSLHRAGLRQVTSRRF
jgi:hypothetical protein